MREKSCGIVVGAGEFTARGIDPETSYLVAADGGFAHLRAHGFAPDLVIGDFDSLGFQPEGEQVIVLPCEKDDTDMAAALTCAWELGFSDLRIYGGYGDRPDHVHANLQLLAHYSRLGAKIRMEAPDFTLYALTDGAIKLHAEAGTCFSVIAHTDLAEHVTIAGDVKYKLTDTTLTNTRALGVSNLFTGKEAEIAVSSGTLFIYLWHIPV